MVFSIPSELPVNSEDSWSNQLPWLLFTGIRLLGVTKPGLDAGLLNGRVGLTSDGEKVRFILDIPQYSVKSNLNINNYTVNQYFYLND